MSHTSEEIEVAASAAHEAVRQRNGGRAVRWEASSEATKEVWRHAMRVGLVAAQAMRGARIKANKEARQSAEAQS